MIEIPILLIGPYCREDVVDHLIIPERRRHRGPKPDRLPALELLASSPNGVSESDHDGAWLYGRSRVAQSANACSAAISTLSGCQGLGM
jgi:hypothetical protein